MPSPSEILAQRIQRPGLLPSLAIHDAFSALIAERAGVEVLFIGGFGITASLYGLPDLNFISATDMTEAIRRITAAVNVPIIADADTGHGDLHNVQFTARSFERAGAAGLILEDQVMPKRCGHFREKQVIPAEEMVLKIRAARAALSDPKFTLIARTDARQVHGLEEAIQRVKAYCKAGANVAFIEAPESRAELEEIATSVPHPLLANLLSGGKTPILSTDQLKDLGYKFAVLPIETLMVTARAIEDLCQAFLTTGKADALAASAMSFEQLKALLQLDRHLGLSQRLRGPTPTGLA